MLSLQEAMGLAPARQWSSAACSYGLVVSVLQAAEQALRQAGLHTSGDQFAQLLRQFLSQRRSDALVGEVPAERRRTVELLPRPAASQARRRLPRLRG